MTTRMSHVGTTIKTIALAAALSAVTMTAASAQAAISEPAAYQAMYPYRDVLNGGAETPAAKLVLLPPQVLQRLQREQSGIDAVAVPRHAHQRGRSER